MPYCKQAMVLLIIDLSWSSTAWTLFTPGEQSRREQRAHIVKAVSIGLATRTSIV